MGTLEWGAKKSYPFAGPGSPNASSFGLIVGEMTRGDGEDTHFLMQERERPTH